MATLDPAKALPARICAAAAAAADAHVHAAAAKESTNATAAIARKAGDAARRLLHAQNPAARAAAARADRAHKYNSDAMSIAVGAVGHANRASRLVADAIDDGAAGDWQHAFKKCTEALHAEQDAERAAKAAADLEAHIQQEADAGIRPPPPPTSVKDVTPV